MKTAIYLILICLMVSCGQMPEDTEIENTGQECAKQRPVVAGDPECMFDWGR